MVLLLAYGPQVRTDIVALRASPVLHSQELWKKQTKHLEMGRNNVLMSAISYACM